MWDDINTQDKWINLDFSQQPMYLGLWFSIIFSSTTVF